LDAVTARPGAADRTARRIRLGDGRLLGFAEYGDAAGAPLFVFHGTPGSRLMAAVAEDAARARGVRIIAPDRPGYGLSSAQPGRAFADWPDDVAALADALGIDRFGVVGVSGGGPHALACAWKIPERLGVVGTVSGVGPIGGAGSLPSLDRDHHAALALARALPWLIRPVVGVGRYAWRRFPERMYRQIQAFGPPSDRALLARPEVARSLIAGLQDGLRGGTAGAIAELRLFTRPWGFPLEDIRIPVHLWHGSRDGLVPLAAARRLAAVIPDAGLEIIPDAGHYVIYDLIERLLGLLRPGASTGAPASAQARASGPADAAHPTG
jgi:pimeloyl-ACP methyl ester carboxylesterase